MAKKKTKAPYIQTVSAKVKIRFMGKKQRRLELTIVLPRQIGDNLIPRLGKRLGKTVI
jgi:hypothetical protein